MPQQLGFIYDMTRCIFCRTCETACKAVRSVEPGVHWRKVGETWNGKYPDVKRAFLSFSCLHCADPACLKACPTGAITKREEDGLVLVDATLCNGCRGCLAACPFDVPQFGADGLMQKCDYCEGFNGGEPVCAAHCPTEALQWGDVTKAPKGKNGKVALKYKGVTDPSLYIMNFVTKKR